MNIANFVTLMSVALGVVSVFLIQSDMLKWVCALFPLIILFDKLDGMVARRFSCESDIGAQLDSLSDALNFGVVISLLIFKVSDIPVIIGIAAIIYNVCAFWRLARFNAEGGHSDSFRGLPTTISAAWLYVFLAGLSFIPKYNSYILVPLMLVFSALMIGTFRYDNKSLFTRALYLIVPMSMILLLRDMF